MKINMKKYEKYDYYTTKPQSFTKYALLVLLAIFFLIVTTFALIEVRNFYNDEPAVVSILMNSFKSSEAQEKAAAIDKEKQNNKELLKLITIPDEYNSERQARAAQSENVNSTTTKSKTYYEEQRPVVVYSKTDSDPTIANRQLAEVPPRQDNDEEDPYKKPLNDDDYGGSDDDYFGQPEPSNQQPPAAYYRQLQQQQQQQSQPYYRQQAPPSYYRQQQQPPQPYYRPPSPPSPYYQSPPNPQYYDDSREDFPGPDNDKQNSEEARSNQYRDYANYYRQYPYATPPPMSANGMLNNKRLPGVNNAENRKMQMPIAAKAQQPQQNRDPYPAYMDDYDYMASPHSLPPQHPYANRPVPVQTPQYRTPSTSAPAEQKQQSGQQMDLLTIIKSLKSMWDIYQSFTSSWNTIAERRNREEELAKQKYKQLEQIRINSKKPPKFNNKRNSTATNKNNKKQTTTTTTIAPKVNNFEMDTSSEEEVLPVKKQPLAKVEPRKGSKGDRASGRDLEGLRDKRQTSEGSTDVGEGRYIKGDPLKGYYDFVITEGSYKFWAAFQVGTAILIIYSTFAAIYYSKVNPLVSDYDYTDYLGGARSLSGGDLDFVDDDAGTEQKAQPKSWLEWLPRTGHSLKFILDAIDKLPTDHAINEKESQESSSEIKLNTNNDEEYTNDKESTEEIEGNNETQQDEETQQSTEDEIENSKESLNSNETKQAM